MEPFGVPCKSIFIHNHEQTEEPNVERPNRKLHETGKDYALRVLKENIIHLNLAPGSMLSENELAQQLGLSRTPVREALQELSKAKLVEIYPQRGSAVSLIDYRLVEEACFMRHVLECAVVERVCGCIQQEELLTLGSNVSLQERYLRAGAWERLWTLDNDFHHLLFTAACMEQTWQMMTGFTVHFDRVRNMSLTAVRNPQIVADHRAIYEALQKGDASTARTVMSNHLSLYKVDEKALRADYPASYFQQS